MHAKVKVKVEVFGKQVFDSHPPPAPTPDHEGPGRDCDLRDEVNDLIDLSGREVLTVTDLMHRLGEIRLRIGDNEEHAELRRVLDDALKSISPWRRDERLAARLKQMAMTLSLGSDQQILKTAAGYFQRRQSVMSPDNPHRDFVRTGRN